MFAIPKRFISFFGSFPKCSMNGRMSVYRLYSTNAHDSYLSKPIQVQAFCSAESFQLGPINESISKNCPLFSSKFVSSDILWVNETKSSSPFSGIFLFSAGCLITWQLEKLDKGSFQSLVSLINPFQQKKLFFSNQKSDDQLQRSTARSSFVPSSDILSLLSCTSMEADEINVVFSIKTTPPSITDKDEGNYAFVDSNTFGDIITISSKINTEASIAELLENGNLLLMERVSISYALARSVRIGFLEHLLNDYLMECRHRELATQLALSGSFGKMKRGDALKALGQMIYCRGQLNLYHSRLQLTDASPDLFWDSSSLLLIYNKISSYLEAPSRISQLNKKMDYASEITGLLRTTLVENHSHFLEVMIIALICIEVGFECVHYYLLYGHPDILGISRD